MRVRFASLRLAASFHSLSTLLSTLYSLLSTLDSLSTLLSTLLSLSLKGALAFSVQRAACMSSTRSDRT